MSSKLQAALIRVEKKLDILLERTKKPAQDGLLYEAPLHQKQQQCPLCSNLVQYLLDDGVVYRECGCKTPT
jgi:hypothetical protein